MHDSLVLDAAKPVARERELRLAVKKGQYVALSEVRETWTKLASRAKDLLGNKFEIELPPILSGLDATGIQEECRRAIDEVLTLLHTGGRRGVKSPPISGRRHSDMGQQWPVDV